MRFITSFLLAALTALPALADTPKFKTQEDFFNKIVAAHDNSFNDDCGDGFQTLRDGVSSEYFETGLNEDGQAAVYQALARCAGNADDRATFNFAHESWRAYGRTDELGWSYRWQLWQQIQWKDVDAALLTANAFLHSPDTPHSELEIRQLWELQRTIFSEYENESEWTRIVELYEMVEASGYRDQDPFMKRFDDTTVLTRTLLKLGRTDDARRAGEAVTDPDAIIVMAVQKLFDPIRPGSSFDHDTDFVALFEQRLTDIETQVALNPQHMHGPFTQAQLLRRLGRPDEAADLLTSTLETHYADPEHYTDADDFLNWVYNDLAYIQAANNELEDALLNFERAIAWGESEFPNVSQMINMASVLMRNGRFDEALTRVGRVGLASDFGKMFVEGINACAAYQDGDESRAEGHLEYLVEHRTENYSALQETYYCMDRLDDAEALLIERLQSDNYSDTALMALQNFRIYPVEAELFQLLKSRQAEVHARAGVQETAAEHGYILNIPIYDIYWGDS